MVLALMTARALAGECAMEQTLEEAEEQLLYLDVQAAEAALDKAEEKLGCRLLTRQEQAKFWLLHGALASFNEDGEGAEIGLRTARAIDSGYWLESLGDDLRKQWEASEPVGGVGRLQITPVPRRYMIFVDGQPSDDEVVLDAGFHLIQVLHQTDPQAAGLGRIIEIQDGDGLVLRTDLKQNEPSTSTRSSWSLVVGLGGGVWGNIPDADDGGRPVGSLEAGLLLDGTRWWTRPSLSVSAGGFSFVQGDELATLPVAPGFSLSGGVLLGRMRVGALTGIQLPGRVPLQAVGAFQLSPRWSLEGRTGVNSVALASTSEETVRRWEPMGALSLFVHF